MLLLKSRKKTKIDVNNTKLDISYSDISDFEILYSKTFFVSENEFANIFLQYLNIEKKVTFDTYIKQGYLYLTIPKQTIRKIKLFQIIN
jgi:hypothetical protein